MKYKKIEILIVWAIYYKYMDKLSEDEFRIKFFEKMNEKAQGEKTKLYKIRAFEDEHDWCGIDLSLIRIKAANAYDCWLQLHKYCYENGKDYNNNPYDIYEGKDYVLEVSMFHEEEEDGPEDELTYANRSFSSSEDEDEDEMRRLKNYYDNLNEKIFSSMDLLTKYYIRCFEENDTFWCEEIKKKTVKKLLK